MLATIALATALVAADATAALSSAVAEDVPVPGGLAALARALEIEPLDCATAVADLSRLRFERDNSERLTAHLRSAPGIESTRVGSAPVDRVPMPLSAALWSQAVFKRAIARDDLFAAVLSDERAALLARGLTALDDETLAFVAARPAMLRNLYEGDVAVWAAFASKIRVHNNRILPPGGEPSIPVWESVVGERVSNPESFVRALLAKYNGRLAYLYDVIGHLDPARQAFALGLWMDGAVRTQRFQALASTVASAFPYWSITKTPFARPQDDLLTLLVRVNVEANGAPSTVASRSVWTAVFPESEAPDESGATDAAWLAETLLSKSFRDRSARLDQFGFGQRLLADQDQAALPDAIYSIRAMPGFRMLMLTLERIGIRRPALYAAMTRHAERIAALDESRQLAGLAQFQGAIAIIARLRRVGSIDTPAADRLLTTLAAVPIDPHSGYRGGVAQWLQDRLLSSLNARSNRSARDVLLDALAGASERAPSAQVSWEGQDYSLDLVASERARIARAFDRNPEASIDAALDLYRGAQPGVRPRAASAAPERIDAAVAAALLSIAYAIDWNDPQGLGRVIRGTVASRHDFGLDKPMAEARARTPWAMPLQVFLASQPWRLEGSILGLDLVLARLALRRVHVDPLNGAPTINEVDRETFIASLGLLNPYELQDSTADEIASAIERGRSRVTALPENGSKASEIISEIRMDGWRTRALRWTLAHDPSRIDGLFSLTELLRLGGGNGASLDAWGMLSVTLHGCICGRMPVAGLESALMGRPQVGMLASAVADLHLTVVVSLRELGLPAALAKTVLAGALREFLDRVRPSHHDDWLTMVRAAQRVPLARIEDYVAAATAGGPLMPVNSSQRNPRQ